MCATLGYLKKGVNMSEDIFMVNGLCEENIPATNPATYADADLTLTSFYGGDRRGRCLQISIHDRNNYPQTAYIQLTKESIWKLVLALLNWLPAVYP
jgi:hypothetical protein